MRAGESIRSADDLAQWGVPGTELGDGFFDRYAYPDWYQKYLQFVSEGATLDDGVDSRELWTHALIHWREYVVPDLLRFYPALGIDELKQLRRSWRDIRNLVLALFGNKDSLIGATFARIRQKEDVS